MLRQYKYEIINYLINLSKRKATTSDKKDLINKMYHLFGRNKLSSTFSKYAKKRINGNTTVHCYFKSDTLIAIKNQISFNHNLQSLS